MHAVTPDPQLVTTGREPSTPACANRARTASVARNVPSAFSRSVYGRFAEPGMCPLRIPARGSGTSPVKRPAARASSNSSACVSTLRSTSPTPRSRDARIVGPECDRLRRRRLTLFGLAAFTQPFRQPAIQHGGIVMTEQPHQPPAARRGCQPLLVVEHQAGRVAHAQPADQLSETPWCRDHVRQVGVGIRDHIDVEISRAWDVGVRGIPRGRPCSRSADISLRRTPRGPACPIHRRANPLLQVGPSFPPSWRPEHPAPVRTTHVTQPAR